ncbi:MAG: CAP domain-containing protein [Ignavibacteria bacterium]|nr:MAG: CAP domain-containing protein [Ignavibacteria bacterium]
MSNRNRDFARIFSRLAVLLISISILVSCSDDDGTGPVVTDPGIPEVENRVHTLINQYRVEQGLAPLTMADVMTTQARIHSRNMADGDVPFSHDGFEDRVEVIKTQINIAGAAENVARNSGFSDPAQISVNGWIDSDGHRNNIEGDYDLTGIGVSQSSGGVYYLTQLFAKSR